MDRSIIFIAIAVLVIGALGFLLIGNSSSTAGRMDSDSDRMEASSTQATDSTTEQAGTMSSDDSDQMSEEMAEMRLDESELVPCTSTEETADEYANPIACVQTNMGTFEFELYLDLVPVTAQNFIDLAEDGFYDGLIFHRVIPTFVIQGGDPLGNGTGGPGHTIPLEIHEDARHDSAGAVAMARAQDPDSAGSQWYVTLEPQPRLDDNYAVFGKVFEGLDVVLAIGDVATDDLDKPLQDVVMFKVTIVQPSESEE